MESGHPPFITVITPSFNQAAYLEQTIRSVLAQELPGGLNAQGLEYMVADGGSTDGSREVIEHYASQLAWWVSEPDRGQTDAINKGLGRARGKYIAWLNSDDLYLPGALAAAIAALEAEPALGLVYGDALSIDELGRPFNRQVFRPYSLTDLARFRIICQPAVVMRRSVQQAAGPLDPSYRYLLDHHLWLRVAALAPIRYLPALLAAARYHPAAKNVQQAAGFGGEAFRILGWMASTPPFKDLLARERKAIEAGAHRFNARYLLDSGRAAAALGAYGQSFRRAPGFTLEEWHRMLYALFSLLGARRLGAWYYRLVGRTPARRRRLSHLESLQGWPGIALNADPS